MALVFSIKPKYTDRIFKKSKLVEFRRQNVNVTPGEKCLIYTTSPIKSITGYFIVNKKLRLPIAELWNLTKRISGTTKEEFFDYFNGCLEGTAIIFKIVKKYTQSITKEDFRKVNVKFTPPQSYYNLPDNLFCKIFRTV